MSTFVDTAGSGTAGAVTVLYLVAVRGLTAPSVGLLLGVAGAAGAIGAVAAPRLLTRAAPRRALVLNYLLQAAFAAALILPGGVLTLTPVIVGQVLLAQTARTLRYLVVAPLDPDGARSLRARLRVVTNIGFGCGALVGAAVSAAGHDAYVPLLMSNSASFVLAASLCCALPEPRWSPDTSEPDADGGAQTGADVRVPHFAALVSVSAAISLNVALLDVAIPLIVALQHRSDSWLVGASMAVNTVLVVAFQVRLARRVTTMTAALRAWRLAALLLSVSCLLLACVSGRPTLWTEVVVIAAVCVQTSCELWHQAGYFRITTELPERSAARLLTALNSGESVLASLGPLLFGLLIGWRGPWGMLLLCLGAVVVAIVAARLGAKMAGATRGTRLEGAALDG